jgi:hypothetical protein
MINNTHFLPEAEYHTECPITLHPLIELAQDNNLVITYCGHRFSQIAITEWLTTHTTCPTCKRDDLTTDKLIPVILKVKKKAEKALGAGAASSNRIAQMPYSKKINGDYTEDEAFQIALSSSEEKKSLTEEINGTLSPEEALKIATEESQEFSTS